MNFVAEGDLRKMMRLFEPLVRRGIAQSFRHYHALLARNVEAAGAPLTMAAQRPIPPKSAPTSSAADGRLVGRVVRPAQRPVEESPDRERRAEGPELLPAAVSSGSYAR